MQAKSQWRCEITVIVAANLKCQPCVEADGGDPGGALVTCPAEGDSFRGPAEDLAVGGARIKTGSILPLMASDSRA